MPSTSTVSRFAVPSTSISTLRSILPVIPSVDPSNVKLPESSSSPEDPAITTLLSVKSLICAEFAVKPPVTTRPPAILPPSSTSSTSIFAVPSTSMLPL